MRTKGALGRKMDLKSLERESEVLEREKGLEEIEGVRAVGERAENEGRREFCFG